MGKGHSHFILQRRVFVKTNSGCLHKASESSQAGTAVWVIGAAAMGVGPSGPPSREQGGECRLANMAHVEVCILCRVLPCRAKDPGCLSIPLKCRAGSSRTPMSSPVPASNPAQREDMVRLC